MSVGVQDGNQRGSFVLGVSITPASAGATTATEQLFTVPGVQATDLLVDVSVPSVLAGVTLGGFRVTAVNQIGICFVNPTAGPLTPPAGVFKITIARPEGVLPATLF